jgi:hypothetical protein
MVARTGMTAKMTDIHPTIFHHDLRTISLSSKTAKLPYLPQPAKRAAEHGCTMNRMEMDYVWAGVMKNILKISLLIPCHPTKWIATLRAS